ncbi:hypothetical protein LSO2F_140045 [Candidatus Liberibacter solanacearum]
MHDSYYEIMHLCHFCISIAFSLPQEDIVIEGLKIKDLHHLFPKSYITFLKVFFIYLC